MSKTTIVSIEKLTGLSHLKKFKVFSSPHCNFKNFTFASLKNNTNKYKKHFTKMLADVGIKSLKLQKQDRRDLSLNRDQIPKTTKTRL